MFVFEEGDRIETRGTGSHSFPSRPANCANGSSSRGLREVGTDFAETADQYVVIAVAA